ncbi:unnamed protein product, partial [Phaeothamnion confervicola]
SLQRIRELTDFRKEALLRLPQVEREVEAMTVADSEAGWAENHEREWDMLHTCLQMAGEETRLQRCHQRRQTEQAAELRAEVDDLEGDLDESAVRQAELREKLRRLEVQRCTDAAGRDRSRAVRVERVRWAIKTTRRNVIRRRRQATGAA